MRSFAVVAICMVAFSSIIGITYMGAQTHAVVAAIDAPIECVEEDTDEERVHVHDVNMDAQLASEPGPALVSPVTLNRSYKVLCSSVDAGTTLTDVLVPTDGGVAGYPLPASAVYIAPNAASSVKVRVGGPDVTSSTGIQIGTSARDGAGVSLDARGPLRCKSEGAAQECDVVVGVQ